MFTRATQKVGLFFATGLFGTTVGGIFGLVFAFFRGRLTAEGDLRRVIVSHGDENVEGNELGLIAAIDGTQRGDIKAPIWSHKGRQYGFSSPVIDGNRVYQIDNTGGLHAYGLENGAPAWTQTVGTGQKAPVVLADGKLYFGT